MPLTAPFSVSVKVNIPGIMPVQMRLLCSLLCPKFGSKRGVQVWSKKGNSSLAQKEEFKFGPNKGIQVWPKKRSSRPGSEKGINSFPFRCKLPSLDRPLLSASAKVAILVQWA